MGALYLFNDLITKDTIALRSSELSTAALISKLKR